MRQSRFRLFSNLYYLALLLPLAAAPALARTGPTIELTVDARQALEGIIRTDMEMPVQPGPLTLYYPKWIPGEHAFDGPVMSVAGLTFTGDGKTIPWKRDLLDAWTFHLDVPQGVSRLHVVFQYLEPSGPGAGGAYTEGVSSTDKLVDVNWNQDLLYLAEVRAQDQTFDATLVLPAGWQFGTALPVESRSGDRISFDPVPLNRLVDSPVIAGQYYRAIDLTPPGEPIHHEIDLVADHPEDLDMSRKVRKGLTNLVAETGALFGARHYRDYHFLLTLSDFVSHFGLEHHESDDSRLPEQTLRAPDAAIDVGALLAHEFTHSWNGKFRRPADLSTPYYEVPEKTDMLWVYEGLTDYLGNVLATRSGLWTKDDYHRYLASIAAALGPGRPGRAWRPLLDTAVAEPWQTTDPGTWLNWSRGTDYYEEGDLLWMEVSTIIDRQTHGRKSFDDFCKLFYGGPNRGPQLKTYTFDQLVEALDRIAPYDWTKFFHERLDSTSAQAPLGGVEAAGWKLEFTDQPPGGRKKGHRGGVNAVYSIGLALSGDGTVYDSIWNGPAFEAGITPGMKVLQVNGQPFAPDLLRSAIAASKTNSSPIELLVQNDGYSYTCAIDYHGGARYPVLVREANVPDYLDHNILRSRARHE
ncbi:MAG TPA: M61 family peptidase [Candidatus Dormibacteraeota bacterium]|nr:M61 family peptidase [Candidatus Dormibacteraeota bacterium]